MNGFAVKGWCPDAWHPMMAGDGLLIRVRPRLARLVPAQLLGLCEAASALGNGLIDLTRRANFQIRGVGENNLADLLDWLVALDLVDADAVRETRCNILVAPEWQAGDDTVRIAQDLMARLPDLPDLPGKVGFILDAGPAPALSREPGDFRIERGSTGELIARADGRRAGTVVARGAEVDALIALARWYVETGGVQAGRMVRHHAELPDWAKGDVAPARPVGHMATGAHPRGTAVAVPFGQVDAGVLAGLARWPGLVAVRVTPWRMLVAEGAKVGGAEGLLTDDADPLLRAEACPGAPRCPQATVETRDLASRLAVLVEGRVHVSGCAKSCAFGGPTDVVLTGHDGAYDLSLNARAGARPIHAGMTRAEVLAHFGAA